MEKQLINPWQWQDQFGYAQAVEITHHQGTLYCSGQAAIDKDGRPVKGGMKEQVEYSLANLSRVLEKAGYADGTVVRLNVYTVSIPAFFEAYGSFAGWMAERGIRPSCTLVEVKALAFPELVVEIEATAVR